MYIGVPMPASAFGCKVYRLRCLKVGARSQGLSAVRDIFDADEERSSARDDAMICRARARTDHSMTPFLLASLPLSIYQVERARFLINIRIIYFFDAWHKR